MADIFHGKRVLFVEDEPLVAMVVEEALESYGAVVTHARSIDEALAALEAETDVAIAVLDINLRGQLSWPIAEALRERGIPFLVTTGYGESMSNQAPEAPLLPKPYSIADLLKQLQELLAADRHA